MALLMRSSILNPQAGTQEAPTSRAQGDNKKYFYLQGELAEMIYAHWHLQETYFAALVRFNECKDSSSFSKHPIAHTEPRRVLSLM